MRQLFSGRRRYALACLVVVGGLLTAAASCEPVKAPVKPPPPPPTGLSISPTHWDFGDGTDTALNPKTFTVTNNGPNTSGTLVSALSGTDKSSFTVAAGGGPNNTCEGKTLPAGDTCTLQVNFTPQGANGFKQADLTVKSDKPDDGEAVARLTGKQV